MNPDVIDLFPSTVLRFRHDNQKIREEIDNIIEHIETNEPLELHFGDDPSKQEHWRDFLNEYNLPNLNTFISDAITHYVGHTNWVLPQSWLNLYPKGSNQNKHLHPGFELSGCYYHNTNEHQGILKFHSPLVQADMECFATYREMSVETFPDTVILFPSWLQHSTTPNTDLERKVSIGFNVTVNKTGEYALNGQWYGKHTLIHEYNGD